MKTKKPNKKEPYLAIPAHILNLTGIGIPEKVLLAHIYSFGAKGCYQSNKTLAEILMVSERTIIRYLQPIRRFLHVTSAKGYYRTLWARSHPDVALMLRAAHRDTTDAHVHQDRPSDSAKSGSPLGRSCPPTNNKTNTETISQTTATPSPLPARGQAPALLDHRRAEAIAAIEKFKARLGRPRSQPAPLTPEQFEQRRQRILASLADPPGGLCLHRKDKAEAL